MNTFEFFGRSLSYAVDPDERTIEIPIAYQFASRFPPESIVELGATTPYNKTYDLYPMPFKSYQIVDPFDAYERCIRADGEVCDYTNWNVLSISTLEHVGTGDYEKYIIFIGKNGKLFHPPLDEEKAVRLLDKIIKQSMNYMMTVPIGYNRKLDLHIFASRYPGFAYQQIGLRKWKVMKEPDFFAKFGEPFPQANVVYFVTNLEFA